MTVENFSPPDFLSLFDSSKQVFVRDFFAGQNRKCVGGSKKDVIYELSGSNYVGLILKILDICLL